MKCSSYVNREMATDVSQYGIEKVLRKKDEILRIVYRGLSQ